MRILDGKKIAAEIKAELRDIIATNTTITPGLGIILVGHRPDSAVYVKMKKKACSEIGIANYDTYLPDDASQDTIITAIEQMNNDPKIHGILVQLPLPRHIDEASVINHVAVGKDVDGFNAINIGNLALKRMNNLMAPCTPEGCIELLDRYSITIQGARVVILGRSNIVGMPLALLFLHRNATVSICHSKTVAIAEITRTADILVAACGQRHLIDRNYIKPGCVIIDVGINSVSDDTRKSGYRLEGDVNFGDVADICDAITPVPGGVGPMTIAMLMKHTVKLALLT